MSVLSITVLVLLASFVAAEIDPRLPIPENLEDFSAMNVAIMLKQSTTTTCLKEHNAERKKNGKKPLKANSQLEKAAIAHNQYMADNDCFDHQCDGEDDLGERVSATGYEWGSIGENIAKGQKDCAAVMKSWMNSKGHKANILSDNVHVGCNLIAKSNLWTCVFGSPM